MCYDPDWPSCYSRKMRKANRNHKCCECNITINKGDTYEFVSGIWNDRPGSYKTCEACIILRDYVSSEDDCGESVPHGILLEAACESASNQGISHD